MNYKAYFPSVKLIDKCPSKKDVLRKSTNHVRHKSYAVDLTSKQNENIYPVNSRTKSKEPVQNSKSVSKKDINDKEEHENPINTKQENIFGITKSNYGEFNKSVLKHKSNPTIKINLSNKVQNKSSNNADSSFHETSNNISSNLTYDKHMKETGGFLNPESNLIQDEFAYSKIKLSNNTQNKIEVDTLEDLHFFYVNVLKQNKSLAFKFEGIYDDCEFKENYEF